MKFQVDQQEFPKNWPLNNCVEKQLLHRSIRSFTDEAIPDATLEMLMEVANRTATSVGMQQSSVIRVSNPEIAGQIAVECNQPYVAQAAELWIFIVDLRRNFLLGQAGGLHMPGIDDMGRFFAGFSDAILMAQNVNNAVESLGLGGVFLGSILNDVDRLIELLQLPELTFPALGYAFGHVGENPQIKPRMPVGLRFFENRYKDIEPNSEEYAKYDSDMTEYYDLRDRNKRVDSFSEQINQKYQEGILKRALIIESIERQGFRVERELVEE